jgi:hypothetical protein
LVQILVPPVFASGWVSSSTFFIVLNVFMFDHQIIARQIIARQIIARQIIHGLRLEALLLRS